MARCAALYCRRGATETRPPVIMSKSRLRWQCRRGMRELDDLLTAYLEQRYDEADADEKAAFAALLELPDPELVGYLLNRQQPAAESIGHVIKHILGRDSIG